MAFISAPHGAIVKIFGEAVGQTILNTFQFRLEDEPVVENLECLGNAMDDWWHDSMLPNLSEEYNYVRTTVTGLEFVNDLFYETNLQAGPGALGGVLLPNNVAFAVKRSSGLTGRSARGRVFIGGMSNSQLETSQTLSGVYVTAFEDALNQLVVPEDFCNWIHVVWSYQTGGSPRSTAYPFGIDRYVAVNNVLDSQRRRLPGRGV